MSAPERLTESSKIRNRTISRGDSASAIPQSMNIIDWTRLDEPVDTRTADEFRRQHAEQARLSLEEFDRYLVVEREGDRWIAVPRTKWKREQREIRKQLPEYVYFARLGDRIKIGVSRDPEDRARLLNAELLGTCLGSSELERDLHTEFASIRDRGEWFRITPGLLYRIERLCTQ